MAQSEFLTDDDMQDSEPAAGSRAPTPVQRQPAPLPRPPLRAVPPPSPPSRSSRPEGASAARSAALSPPEAAEQRREAVEGKAPELADAPVANAVLAGALTPGALARLALAGGASGLRAALGSGINFGVQQGLQDWADKLLSGPLQRHPYLREMLGIAGGVAMGHVLPGAERLPGLRQPGTESQVTSNTLQRLAQKRVLEDSDQQVEGTATPIFEPPRGAPPSPPSEPILLSEPESEPASPTEPPPEPFEPLPPEPLTSEPTPGRGPAAPEPAEPIEPLPEEPLKPVPQPKDELEQAAATNNAPQLRQSLHQELERHPSATVYDMKVGDIKRDPQRFQYKTLVNRDTGADAALKDVKTYDRGLSGVVTTYHDMDGQHYVVNGHGRAAALDLLEGLDSSHRVQVIESRLANHPDAVKGAISYGKTPEQARAYGALINIAEGRGTAIDAARFIRGQGMNTADLQSAGIALNPTEEKTQRAVSMSRLSPMLFRNLDVGILPEKLGVTIGRELGDQPTVQDAVFQMLKTKAGNIREVSASKLTEMMRLAKSSGETTEKIKDLFGEQELRKSLIREQADIITGLKTRLRGEKRLFGRTAEAAEQLEAAGVGKIDVETGEQLSAAAANNLDLLNRLVYSKGPVNQAVREAAEKLSKTPGKKSALINEAYQRVIEELDKVLPEAPEPAPQGGLFGS